MRNGAQWTATRQRDPHGNGKGDGDVADTRAWQPSRHWQLHKGKKLRRETLKTVKLARAQHGQHDAHRWRPWDANQKRHVGNDGNAEGQA